MASGAPPITLFNDDGSIGPRTALAVLLVGGRTTAADFTVDAERVAVRRRAVVSSGTSFFTSSGTSSKWVYNAAGVLVNVPAGTLAIDYDPVTHAARGLLCEPAATNIHPQSNDLSALNLENGTATLNNQTGPDGTLTVDTYTENTATGTHGGYGTRRRRDDYTFAFPQDGDAACIAWLV